MLLGKFLTDLSWLVVASVVKKVSFCARSVENKLVYQILGGDTISTSSNTESHIDVVNLRVDNGVLVPIVSQVAITNPRGAEHAPESHEDKESPSYDVEGLRRSKRRHVQPERYLGCEVSKLDVGSFRNRPPVRIDTSKDDEMSLPLSCLFGLQQKNCPEEEDADAVADNGRKANKANTCKELLVYNRKAKTQQVKKCGADQGVEHQPQPQLAIIPVPDEDDEPIAIDHGELNDKVTRSYEHESAEISSKYRHLINSPKLKRNSIHLLTLEAYNLPAKSDDAEKSDDFYSRSHYSYGTPKSQRKSLCGLDHMGLGNKWERIKSNKGSQERKYHSTYSRSRNHGEERHYNYKDRTLNATAYKELINSYLKNINARPVKEELPITDQWKQCNTPSSFGQKGDTEKSDGEDAEETSEIDMLWREMEVSLASCYLEDTEVSPFGHCLPLFFPFVICSVFFLRLIQFHYLIRVQTQPFLLRRWKNRIKFVNMIIGWMNKLEYIALDVAL